ncbi:MAG: virulence RhuM family protein [Patescibacteria group bacterium]|nr:virulence RhuM family protein [Patescibacteria group bacterium]
MENNSQIILYQTEDGKTRVEVRFEHENVWLTQKLIAELFDTTVANINIHLKNIFQSAELQQDSVIKDFLITAADSKKYKTKMYALEVIIAVGYRVNSDRGILFRQWATERLKEYMVKGFTMDDTRLKQGGYKSRYFEELLERIRDIRSSERMLYQKVTDIYATSIDYRKDDKLTKKFFATVQNKMHFAVHGHTAAELIAKRANARKQNMGLSSFKGHYITVADTHVAKNYLDESELKQLNLIVSLYLDFAELQATNGRVMKMKDWITKLDEFLKLSEKEILTNTGKISAETAEQIASQEYEKYRFSENNKVASDFDKEIKKIQKF